MPEEKKWITRAKRTLEYHRKMCLTVNKWNITKTAKSLRRPIGGVCEDLLIARWLRAHEGQLDKFEFACDALEFIREKKKQLDLD
jgi:hypothetical protein